MGQILIDQAGRPADRSEVPVLEVDDLHVEFRTASGLVRAVNGVSYAVREGETLAILGESGSGKSVSAQAIMGILDSPPGFITQGAIRFRGKDMLTMAAAARRRIRGEDIAIIFQDALSSLNPVFTVGFQIGEMFRAHRGASRKEAKASAVELMERVRIPAAKERVNDFPHQFSGGMRQRVMIAMSLACDPKLLVADEPTTALDVTIQAQVLKLMLELKAKIGSAVILITHDLGVVAETCQRVVVMYAGRKVEEAPVAELFAQPAHPYTRGLLASIARGKAGGRAKRLNEIPGMVPSLRDPIGGCAFAPRCRFADARCRTESPDLTPIAGQPRHRAACLRLDAVLAS